MNNKELLDITVNLHDWFKKNMGIKELTLSRWMRKYLAL